MRKRIGDFLIERGVLNPTQVEAVLQYGREHSLRFGDAALALGIIGEPDLVRLFGRNQRADFFHLEAAYFPEPTKDLLSREEILRWGALPLGIKTEYRFFRARSRINIGMLDPGRKDAIDAIRAAAAKFAGVKNLAGIKVYLILADQFLDVAHKVYGITDSELAAFSPAALDPTLSLFVHS